jgi:hypothetical protein
MHMGMGRLWTILVVMVLSFVGIIFLESKMSQYATLELVIIVIGILLSIVALVGIAAESRWSWPFATVLFSLSLANIVFEHVNVGAFITFVLLLIVNIFGMLIAVLSIEDVVDTTPWNPEASSVTSDMTPLETYQAAAESKVTYNTAPKKSSRKKKR